MTRADPLQVCHLVGALGSGGRESLLLDIVENTGQSVDHTVFSLDASDRIASEFERAGATVGDGAASSYTDVGAIGRTFRFLGAHEFDVLHAHGPTSQVPGRVLGRVAGTSAVVSTHHIVRGEHEWWMNVLETLTRPLDTRTVAVSGSVRESYGGGERWRVIRNGIDVEGFREAVRDAADVAARDLDPEADPVFLNVGRYIPQKSQRDLIEAMPAVLETFPGAHLYVVGGRGGEADDLRERAAANAVEGHVTVTGRVPSVAEYYARADVYVSSSVNEGLPIVLLEAMAAGLPVVATDVPGNRDAVLPGESGSLVEPRDPAELAEAMRRVAVPEVREEFGERGLRRVRERYSIATTVSEYVSLYHEVTGRRWPDEPNAGSREVSDRG